MAVLITGGAGYIGSHTCIALMQNGFEVVIVDNLCNSKKEVLSRIEELSGKSVKFYKADVCDADALREIFKNENIDSVIHFAGLKAVGESCQKPMEYYENNIISTLSLCRVMAEFGVKKLVFLCKKVIKMLQMKQKKK